MRGAGVRTPSALQGPYHCAPVQKPQDPFKNGRKARNLGRNSPSKKALITTTVRRFKNRTTPVLYSPRLDRLLRDDDIATFLSSSLPWLRGNTHEADGGGDRCHRVACYFL
jgi:hypothetical protein